MKCVIVGGGYAGSRLAYQVDSVFHVTLVDEKNFFEPRDELPGLLCMPPDEFEGKLREYLALHRYYLRRSKVFTSRVVDVTENEVVLRSGKRIPFDILVMATGERRAFPGKSTANTADLREAELRHMNAFLRNDCSRIAVVGGGPLGCSWAGNLAHAFPDKDIHLFHSGVTLVPTLPLEARERTAAHLDALPGLTVHRNCEVANVRPVHHGSWWQRGRKVTFDLQTRLRDGKPLEIPSVVTQIWYGKMPPIHQDRGSVIGDEAFTGFDYVLLCNGNEPTGREFRASAVLGQHIDANGRFQVSNFMQLLGLPNVFCLGRCNNLKWVRSTGNSDFQARLLFRNFLGAANKSEAMGSSTSSWAPAMTPISAAKMSFPRLIISLGPDFAAGSNAWSGSLAGLLAVKDLNQDRKYYYREFHSPMFYKPHEDSKVRAGIDAWLRTAVTDIADYDVS